MNITHLGIVMLLRSGITGEKLALPETFSIEDAAVILRRQSVAPLAYQGAVNCGFGQESAAIQQMLSLYYRSLLKHERQMCALEQLLRAFEESAVPHMPVKGCNIKKLYPKPELRAMGDADILIHPEQHDRIRPVMEGLGFTFLRENDHVFEWKSDDLYVELHKSLIPPDDEDFHAYYGTGWRLAQKRTGYRYDLSDEDAYLFAFTHFARHYRRGGIGCRHVVDLFVYRNLFPRMDMGYIYGELRKLNLTEFHNNIMKLLDVWFAGHEGDSVTELISAFIFSGGNWGTMEAGIFAEEVKAARKAGKVKNAGMKAIIRAVFPPISQLSYRYTIVRKYPVTLPVVWVVRWFDILLFRPQKIRKRVNALRMVSNAEVLSHQSALRAVGLDFHTDSGTET